VYLEEPQIASSNFKALDFWKEKSSLYPNIAQIAKLILAIPPTSVPCERVFSDAGNIVVTAKRTQLDHSKVESLLFVYENTFRPFKKYNHFKEEVNEIMLQIEIIRDNRFYYSSIIFI